MGLVTCTDCGADVSDRALACPKCGGPIDNAGASQGTAIQQAQTSQSSSASRINPGDKVVLIKTGRLMSYNNRKKVWKKNGKLKFAAGRKGVCVGENRFVLEYGLNNFGVILTDQEVAEYLAPLSD